MRSSARSTDLPSRKIGRRTAGFTLVEVMISATLFAIVLGIVLKQLTDTTKLSKVALARADLRRLGEHILSDMANDLRSSQTLHCGGQQGDGSNSTSTGMPTLEFHKIIGWDSVAQQPLLDNTNGTAGGGTLILTRYSEPTTPVSTYNGSLEFCHHTVTAGSGPTVTPTAILTTELFPSQGSVTPGVYPPRGFSIVLETGSPPAAAVFPGLMSVNLLNVFSGANDKPYVLTLTLNMRRNVGFKGAAPPAGIDPTQLDATGILEAVVTVKTTVELRPSSAY